MIDQPGEEEEEENTKLKKEENLRYEPAKSDRLEGLIPQRSELFVA
jgi:hypothetical protein